MSHVTDGELHLVLDGALELLSADRAREVREHLEACGDCGRRLEEERRIRDRSQELLRSTDPGAESPPPFEEIRARAGRGAGGAGSSGSSGMRGTPWLQGLAWVATVILALGIGWYAGGRPPGAGTGADRVSRAADAPGDEAVGDARASEPRADAAEMARPAPSPRRQEEGGGLATAAAPQETPEPGDARAKDAVAAPATARTAATAVPARGAAAMAREGSLAIPGLPVLAVEWERSEGEEDGAALRLLQALPGGDTLVLRYAAAGAPGDDAPSAEEKVATPAAPAAAESAARDRVPAEQEAVAQARLRAPAPTGEETGRRALEDRAEATEADDAASETGVLRLRRGPWSLEARASLPVDSLRALLERLPPPE